MQLTNPWFGYSIRTYEQYKASSLTRVNSAVPEITDHTETDPYIKAISIWAGMFETLHYYGDANAREMFLPVARQFESAVKLADLFDYRVKGSSPASVSLRFTSDVAATGNITIPIGTRVKNSDGIVFSTISAGIILTGTTFIDIPAKQWEIVNSVALGNSDGNAYQEFPLEEKVADGSVIVTVNAIAWQAQDTFAISLPTDTHFIAGIREDKKMRIRFSDDFNGKIPPSTHPIAASYYITQGTSGIVGAGLLTILMDAPTVPGGETVTVINLLGATGGSDTEDLRKLKKRIPLSLRTLYRGVTDQDFIDLAELVQGVEVAGVDFNCDEDDIVHIFITPEGGGIAAAPLLSAVYDFIKIREVISVEHEVIGSGILNFLATINVKSKPGYSNLTVGNNIKNTWLNFFLPQNQKIKGYVVLGDLYEVIESTDGVLYSDIALLIPVPYARNITVPATQLVWTRATNTTSTITQKWLMRFITNSQYELYRGTDFVGSFMVDILVSLPEINFTVNGVQTSGHNFEFYTYAYNKSVFLAEPSIPFSDVTMLTVNVTGGV